MKPCDVSKILGRGTDKLLREAFADIAERVSKETGVPALAGSPEGSS